LAPFNSTIDDDILDDSMARHVEVKSFPSVHLIDLKLRPPITAPASDNEDEFSDCEEPAAIRVPKTK
jgi:hypothetical protein